MKFYYPTGSELGSSSGTGLELGRAGQLQASSLRITLKGGRKLCGKLMVVVWVFSFPVRPWSYFGSGSKEFLSADVGFIVDSCCSLG